MKEVGVFEILLNWLSYRVVGIVARGKLKRVAWKQTVQDLECHAKVLFYKIAGDKQQVVYLYSAL